MKDFLLRCVKNERNIVNLESANSFTEWRQANSQVIHMHFRDNDVTCSCKEGMKKKWCKHRVAILIKREVIEVSEEVLLNVQLGQKRRRGRPRKATRARDFARDY